jgi:hypothetical protein
MACITTMGTTKKILYSKKLTHPTRIWHALQQWRPRKKDYILNNQPIRQEYGMHYNNGHHSKIKNCMQTNKQPIRQ